VMLHRLKLRVVYGRQLDADRSAKRLKLRVILLSGFAVFFPFLGITYFLFSETRATKLLIIGIMAALSCVPVVLYAYAKGFGRPLRELWRERSVELASLAIKIGFFYGFALYWMILGIVEFLFGYQSFRAALISFVASAAARDGFEIGYLRGLSKDRLPKMTIFPDNRPISELLRAAPLKVFLLVSTAGIGSALIGLILGLFLDNARHQILLVGLVTGIVATVAYAWALEFPPRPRALLRYFIWPGFTMGVTYFLILAYLLRIIFQVALPQDYDLALLMGICAAWLTLESLFVAYIQWNKPKAPTLPQEAA